MDEGITRKVGAIHYNIAQIDAYLSLILKGEIDPGAGFSLISKNAKSIVAYCNGALIPAQKPKEKDQIPE